MTELVKEAPFMYSTELENVVSLCIRALDGSNYDVRCDVSSLLGLVLATTQQPKNQQQQGKWTRVHQYCRQIKCCKYGTSRSCLIGLSLISSYHTIISWK